MDVGVHFTPSDEMARKKAQAGKLTWGKWLYEAAEKVTVGLAVAITAVWAIEPWRNWLERRSIIDDETITAIVVLMVLLVFKSLSAVEDRLSALAATSTPRNVISDGVNRVYPIVTEVVDRINETALEESERCIDVIGLTLFSAWPYLEGRIRKYQSTGWTIRMLCLDPAYIRTQTALASSWAGEAEKNIEQIKAYLDDERDTLEKKRITVELFTYSRLPAIHGFAIGGRDVVISFCHWDKKGRIARPYEFYEHFPSGDGSERARFYRELFANWRDELLKAATRVL